MKWQILSAFCFFLSTAVKANVPDYSATGTPITQWTCNAQAQAATDNLLANAGFDDDNIAEGTTTEVTTAWSAFSQDNTAVFIANLQNSGSLDVYTEVSPFSQNAFRFGTATGTGSTTYASLQYTNTNNMVQDTASSHYTLSFYYGREGSYGVPIAGHARLQVVWNGKVVATADLTAASISGDLPTELTQYCVPADLIGSGADSLAIYVYDDATRG